ncbi:hypothetical protein TPHA_0E02740 [Tetrapisispora phaffii CBS 4417]|uniref:ML-like domain-containing protein n=1 Tax=Tetrapisispora phaffii (strain ATCC 24235 / CBS 4417 / NBRC 1672 / NRRL Y-8282 / UCD 70-5) TaxID=1071381 RepID=G8BTY6_TETPH|nr:hypothetical protein TPHA_0E02740 [Tetrapisispora phaffii CBS 4417]CCE63364.1 hypothetical protein TPHA_0E02740 [Tetrapisispora phaffii CBS 4417]
MKLIFKLCLLILNFNCILAKRTLVANSLVTCKEDSALSANSFDVVFNPDDNSLHYTLDLVTQLSGNLHATVDVYAYGFKIITEDIDFCNLEWKQFCPIYPGDVQIESIEYISTEYTDQIPGIAYQVPDIDAYARLNIYNNESDYLACLEIFFTNGKTVSQTGVKWASAVVAGIGLLLSAVLSTFGKSTAASHISANTMSLFLYFQSVVIVSMQHVHRVPPIAEAWAENLAWSMGLIRVSFMQKIFRWYVESTGGNPTLYLTSTTISVLTQRSLDYLKKRASNILYGNTNTLIFRGIKRLAFNINIENTSVVCTGFTFFVLCGYVLAGFIMCCKYCIELSFRLGWIKDQNRFYTFRNAWRIILKGSLLRYVFIGFSQLTLLSFWEFTEVDSGAVVTIACLFVVLSIGLMAWSAFRTHYFAQKSIKQYNNPAALLYGDDQILSKYGFFYTMFNAKHYWWNTVIICHSLIRSLFVGFSQASGKTQALAIWLCDLFYVVAVIRYQPYLDRPTNIINIFISVITVLNSFFFLFFSDLFGQPYTVSAIMGWIFFIMNAAFSFILLMMILTFTAMIVFSKNPDLRFKPANDDRNSFQRNFNSQTGAAANELLALGDLVKDHTELFDRDIQDQKDSNKSSSLDEYDLDEKKVITNDSTSLNDKSFSGKVLRNLTFKGLLGKKSKRPDNRTSNSNNNLPITSLSGDEMSKGAESPQEHSFFNENKKNYPGHIRQESESNNGLITSYDDENGGRLSNPFHLSQPNIFETRSESKSSSIANLERDSSYDSLGGPQDATRNANII